MYIADGVHDSRLHKNSGTPELPTLDNQSALVSLAQRSKHMPKVLPILQVAYFGRCVASLCAKLQGAQQACNAVSFAQKNLAQRFKLGKDLAHPHWN